MNKGGGECRGFEERVNTWVGREGVEVDRFLAQNPHFFKARSEMFLLDILYTGLFMG